MKTSTFSQRLREAMYIRRLNQTDLHLLTGIGKSSISTYLKGDYKAKQDKVDLLAKILDVSPAWLMGYDVPMESVRPQNNYSTSSPPHAYIDDPNHMDPKPITYTAQQQTLLAETASFTEEQYDKLFDYINFLKLSKSS